MRAYSWIVLGSALFACSGAAFTDTSNSGGGGGTDSDAGTGGALGHSGRTFGGSLNSGGGKVGASGSGSGGTGNAMGGTGNATSGTGNTTGGTGTTTGGVVGMGGKISAGGDLSIAGDLSIGGDLVAGGSVSMSGSGGSATMGGTGGTNPDPVDLKCPEAQPAAGAACKTGLSCTFGNDVRTTCRPSSSCEGGKWTNKDPACKALTHCGTLNAGEKCDVQGSSCLKDGYQYCQCSLCSGNVCGNEPTWNCAGGSSSQGCQKIAPNVGQACTSKLTCMYGSCGIGAVPPTSASCDGDTWSWEPTVCPQ